MISGETSQRRRLELSRKLNKENYKKEIIPLMEKLFSLDMFGTDRNKVSTPFIQTVKKGETKLKGGMFIFGESTVSTLVLIAMDCPPTFRPPTA